jgi:hypothetical protein
VTGGTLTASVDNTIGGGALTVASGATLALGTTTQTVDGATINGTVTGSGAGTLDLGSGGLTLAGATVSAKLSGSGAITSSGAVTLSGANTLTGTTAVTGGTLTASVDNTIGDGALTVASGATLAIGTTTQTVNGATINGTVTGSGTLTSQSLITIDTADISAALAGTVSLTSSGTSILKGQNTYDGGTTVTAGALTIAGSLKAGSDLTVSTGASANFSESASLGTISGGGSTTVGGALNLVTLNAVGGTLTLNGENNAIGTLTEGSVSVNGSTTITNLNGGNLAVASGKTVTASNGGLLTGTLSGAGSLNAAGSLTIGVGATVSGFTGEVRVATGGSLTSSAIFAQGNALTLSSGSTASFSGNSLKLGAVANNNASGTYSLTFSGNDVELVSLSGTGDTKFMGSGAKITTLTASGNISGSVRVTTFSGGTLSLSDASVVDTLAGGSLTLSSGTSVGTVSGGTLSLTNGGEVGTLTAGTVNANGGTTTITSLGAGTINLAVDNGATMRVAGGSSSATISGEGTLEITGSTTIGGLNNYSGDLKVTGGTFSVTGTMNAAKSLEIASGSIADLTGSIVLETLTNGGTFKGGANVTTGELKVNGTTQVIGNFILPSIATGTVTVGGELRAASGGVEVSGGTVTVAGKATLGDVSSGTVTLNGAGNTVAKLLGGTLAANGDTTVGDLSAGSVTVAATKTLTATGGTFAGTLSGAGSLNAAGSLTIGVGATVSGFTGEVRVATGGSLTSSAIFAQGNALTLSSGSTASFSGNGLKLGAVANNNASGSYSLTFSGNNLSLVSLGGEGDTEFTGTSLELPAIIDTMTATGKVSGYVKVLNTSGGASSFAQSANLTEIVSGTVTLEKGGTVEKFMGGNLIVAENQRVEIRAGSSETSTLELKIGSTAVGMDNSLNLKIGELSGAGVIGDGVRKVNLSVGEGKYDGSVNGSLTKYGNGTLEFTKPNPINGAVVVEGGTLKAIYVQTNSLTVSDATADFLLKPAVAGQPVTLSSALGTTMGTIDVSAKDDGTAGGLRIANGTTVQVSSSAKMALNVGSGAALNLNVTSGGELELTSPTLGAGTVNLKVGPVDSVGSKLTVTNLVLGGTSGVQTLSGIGTLVGNLDGNGNGAIRPGNSPGRFTIEGNVNLGGGLRAFFETAPNTWSQQAANARDEIVATGNIVLGIGTVVLETAPNGGARLSPSLLKGVKRWDDIIQSVDGIITTAEGIAALAQVVDAPVSLEVKPVLSADKKTLSLLVSRRALIYTELLNAGIVRGLDVNQALSTRLNAEVGADQGGFYGWTSGFGSNARQKGDASIGISGFSSNNWGDVLGADRNLGNASVGVFVSMLGSSVSSRTNADRARTTSTMGGVYGIANLGEVRLTGAVAAGQSDTRVTRISKGVGISGNADSSEWLAQVGVSLPKALASEEGGYIPSAEILVFGQDFKDTREESNAFQRGIRVKNPSGTTTISKIGFEAFKKTTFAGKDARISASVQWLHNFNAENRTASAAWINGGEAGTGFEQFTGSKLSADAVRLSTGARLQLTERVNAGLQADVQVQGGQTITRGNLNIGVAF